MQQSDSLGIERFAPIEGLRAWLAWAVFFEHIAQVSGLNRVGIPTRATAFIGDTAVQVFINVSGFVITHLLLTRQDSYGGYITRRFFRLFPVFLVCIIAGGLAIHTSVTPWPAGPAYASGTNVDFLKATQTDHFWSNVVLHLTMLHGAVPNNVLSLSQYAFLPPAWSVSLEWQFYLVAPFVILAMRRPVSAAFISATAVVGLFLYYRGVLGQFRLPSLLPGSSHFFLAGIASRIMFDRIRPSAPLAVAVAALGFGFLFNLTALGIWLAFFTYMFCDRERLVGTDRALVALADAMFSSPWAKWAGQRTYSVYLPHFPIMLFLLTAISFANITSPVQVALLLLIVGFPVTVLIVELVHTLVELPGIKLGHRIARWQRIPPETA